MVRALAFWIFIIVFQEIRGQIIQQTSPEAGVAFLAHNDSIKRIDFHNGNISALSNTGWIQYRKFETLADPMRLLLHPTPIVTQTKDTAFIHFLGSGLVYCMNRHGILERLDRTFYAGYNFSSFHYFSGEKLWSLGGNGIWRTTDLTIYYDAELREWEKHEMRPEISNGFTDMFASAAAPNELYTLVMDGPQPAQLEPTFTAYKVNLNTHTFEKIGVAATRKNGPAPRQLTPFAQYDRTNFVSFENRIYLVDLVANTIEICEPMPDSYSVPFNGVYGMLLSPTGIHLIQTASTVTNLHVKWEFFTYDAFLEQMGPKPFGPVYESGAISSIKSNWEPILLIAIGFSSLTIIIVRYQRLRPSVERNFAQSLSPLARITLRHLLLQNRTALVSPDELNQVLGIEDKTWDNQRKIRSTVLQELEEKGMQFLGVPSFIERVASEEDRRIRRYRIKDELREDLLPALKHV